MKSLKLLLTGLLVLSACSKQVKDHRKPHWLYMNFGHEPSVHDVRRTTEHTVYLLASMVFEGLVRVNPEGEIEPAQAEKIEISEDGKTYVFHLRDCHWSNGQPVTAQDFASSWLSCLDSKIPSPNAYFFFCIKNAKAAQQGQVPLDQVGIEVRNEKCLVIHLENPTSHFLEIIASEFAFPMKYKDGSSDFQSLLSNGPFMIKGWTPAREIILVKNPHFRSSDKIKLKGIHISLVEEEASSVALFQHHHLDLIGTPFSFISHSIENGMFNESDAYILPGTLVSVCNFNTERFPLNNVNFRKALACAIEKEKLAESMQMFHARAATALVPDAFIQHGRSIFGFCGQDKAKEFLAMALQELDITKKQLPKLKFTYPLSKENDAIQKIAQIIQHQWREHLGLEIELEALEIKQVTAKLGQRDFDIGFVSWEAYYPSPFCYFERFLAKTNKKNYTGWENPQFISFIQNAIKTEDHDLRLKYFNNAEKVMEEDMPLIPVIFWDYCMIKSERVRGLKLCKNGALWLESLEIISPKDKPKER